MEDQIQAAISEAIRAAVAEAIKQAEQGYENESPYYAITEKATGEVMSLIEALEG